MQRDCRTVVKNRSAIVRKIALTFLTFLTMSSAAVEAHPAVVALGVAHVVVAHMVAAHVAAHAAVGAHMAAAHGLAMHGLAAHGAAIHMHGAAMHMMATHGAVQAGLAPHLAAQTVFTHGFVAHNIALAAPAHLAGHGSMLPFAQSGTHTSVWSYLQGPPPSFHFTGLGSNKALPVHFAHGSMLPFAHNGTGWNYGIYHSYLWHPLNAYAVALPNTASGNFINSATAMGLYNSL